jgi:L-alanine-DL-glutamate epimerase-like enolase superfamily enzyme
MVEYLTGSPYIDALVAEPWRLDADGMLAIPAAPGLGIRLDPDNLARYTNGERLLAP